MARATERTWPILNRLRACPSAHVVVCECETAADAAAQLLPDRFAVISPGGSNGFHKAGMGALAGPLVTIWPDACPTGFEIRRGRVPGASGYRARSYRRGDAGQGNGDGRPRDGWTAWGGEVVELAEGTP